MSYSGNGGSVWVVRIVAALTVFLIILIGIGLGLSIAMTRNIKNNENFVELAPALPTRILDINGTLVTEFASDEKRELVSLNELPRHLIQAVLAREDPDFYNHRGFSIRAIGRAAFFYAIGKPRGGGSTITQQVAGTLYTDRSERTVKRKLKELWWAFQIERRYTKNEILEIYLNYMPMGPGTYGVETSSKHFFGHSAREVSIAESAVLAVLLSGPSLFDPIRNPALAQDRQKSVIDRMVEFGYITAEEGEASFNEYWENFDWTQASVSAFFRREDKAPWFSEHVRRELDVLLYGTRDYYRDGYVVHTTLDLRHQAAAERFIAEGLEKANTHYAALNRRSYTQAERVITPILDLLTVAFDLTSIRATQANQREVRALSYYTNTVNPILDLAALALGVSEIKDVTNQSFAELRVRNEQNVVEGALISIENETGYITAIVGGSRYSESNQLIRATQARVQYGSAFKPLYYSAALDTRHFNAGTMIRDEPIVFFNDDGTPYIPSNFRGEWRGSVLFYYALVASMNVPSIQILDTIGFNQAIDRAALLLDITDPTQKRQLFPRVYPVGLGITASSPLRIARAYAIFGNQGRDVTPIAIRYIEDRNGRTIYDVEGDIRQRQRRSGSGDGQIISQQNAYIMTKIMERVVNEGALNHFAARDGSHFTFRDEQGTFRMPIAGKTGTPQNWSDAWAVGYSPYYTVAVWFGFDRLGNSLGTELTGASLAGPVWGDYLREIHRGLPRKNFVRPSGIVDITVCSRSGLYRTNQCRGGVTLPFMQNNQPRGSCTECGRTDSFQTPVTTSIDLWGNDPFSNFQMPTISPEFMEPPPQQQTQTSGNRGSRLNRNNSSTTSPSDTAEFVIEMPSILQNTPIESIEENANTEDDFDLPGWNPLE